MILKFSITNGDGLLIASTNSNNNQKNFISCLSSIWWDYFEIGR